MTALASNRGSQWQTNTNTDVALYTIVITATGPTGVTKDASFTLNVNPDCSIQILTPSVTANHTYRVYDSKVSYEVQEFANDESTHCPLTYSHIFDTSQTWLTVKTGRKMEWQTDSNTNIGVHTIIVKATGPEAVTVQTSYTLTVTKNCSKQILTQPTNIV